MCAVDKMWLLAAYVIQKSCFGASGVLVGGEYIKKTEYCCLMFENLFLCLINH
jgi:hypothetical protein